MEIETHWFKASFAKVHLMIKNTFLQNQSKLRLSAPDYNKMKDGNDLVASGRLLSTNINKQNIYDNQALNIM